MIHANEQLLDFKEIVQIKSDVVRCINLHPAIRNEQVQTIIIRLICSFMAQNPECTYI